MEGSPRRADKRRRACGAAFAAGPAACDDRVPEPTHDARMKSVRRLAACTALVLASPALLAQTDPLKAAAAEPGAKVTASGLVFRSLKEGTGPSPAGTDTVKVNYRGTFPDGREFDSSYKRNQPATFPLNRVIKCWTEGLQLMKVGSSARLTCPASIAYGERGAGGSIPPNAVLHFEVELLAINP
jgi:FKBP-type peptidyl-prolyl cis-trans isomerase FkpA